MRVLLALGTAAGRPGGDWAKANTAQYPVLLSGSGRRSRLSASDGSYRTERREHFGMEDEQTLFVGRLF